MGWQIWVGIVVAIILIVFILNWIGNRKSKDNYAPDTSSGGLWEKVKDACCIRG